MTADLATPAEPSFGEQLDAIMREMDVATETWAVCGRRYEGLAYESREAVFAKLRDWNVRLAESRGTFSASRAAQ